MSLIKGIDQLGVNSEELREVMRHMPVETLAEEIFRVACFNDQKLHFIASEADDTLGHAYRRKWMCQAGAGHADFQGVPEEIPLRLVRAHICQAGGSHRCQRDGKSRSRNLGRRQMVEGQLPKHSG